MRALQGLDPDRVIYLGTTSKTLAPALRLGWLVVPESLVQQLAALKRLLDNFSPTLEQRAFALLIERGHYQRQIRKTRTVYRARRDLLIATLREQLPELTVSGVAAGLSVTLHLPAAADDRELARTAREAGIALEALTHYTINDRGLRGLVIGYGRLHETAIRAAIDTLTATLRLPLDGSA